MKKIILFLHCMVVFLVAGNLDTLENKVLYEVIHKSPYMAFDKEAVSEVGLARVFATEKGYFVVVQHLDEQVKLTVNGFVSDDERQPVRTIKRILHSHYFNQLPITPATIHLSQIFTQQKDSRHVTCTAVECAYEYVALEVAVDAMNMNANINNPIIHFFKTFLLKSDEQKVSEAQCLYESLWKHFRQEHFVQVPSVVYKSLEAIVENPHVLLSSEWMNIIHKYCLDHQVNRFEIMPFVEYCRLHRLHSCHDGYVVDVLYQQVCAFAERAGESL